MMLGGNRDVYVTLKKRSWSPASYYSGSRSLSVCTYESSTGKLLATRVIETVHRSAPDAENWITKYDKVPPVDIAKIVRSIKDFEYAWPLSPDKSYPGQLFATPHGLVAVNSEGKISTLVELKALLKLVPWYLNEWNSNIESSRNLQDRGMMQIEKACESCGWWGDPKLKANDSETSVPEVHGPCGRSRTHCSHVQVVQTYGCGGHLYALIKEGNDFDEEGGARSAIVRVPAEPGEE